MEKFNRVEEVEGRLEAIDAERVGLLKELRDLMAKERFTDPSFTLSPRPWRAGGPAGIGKDGHGLRDDRSEKSGDAHTRKPADASGAWLNRLQEFLGLSKKEVGQWRGARKKLTGRVDVAMIQTLANLENPKASFRDYGYVLIDECHHIPAVTLEALLKECGSRFITGLTATPERKDRLERLLYQQCGPIRHFISPGEQDSLVKQVYLRTSDFIASQGDGKPLPLHLVWQRMVADGPRNEQIASDVAAVAREGRAPIVLSDRKEHLERLSELVAARLSCGEVSLVTIEGSLSPRKRQAALAAFSSAVLEKRPACLFATSSLLGEGFDLPILDTLFLTMPISFKGRLVQYAGRLHRASPGKKNVLIYDYLDEQLPLACSMYRKRLPAYRSMGYVVVKDEDSKLDLEA